MDPLLLIIVVIILLAVFGGGYWGYRGYGGGFYGPGLIGVVVTILVIALLLKLVGVILWR